MFTFAITGFGRSGTKFLAKRLGQSKQYTVEHEPSPSMLNIQHRFNRHCYGEVNSFLLYSLSSLIVTKKLVILRSPFAIFCSCLNIGHPETIQTSIQAAIALLDGYIRLGIPFVRFESFIGNSRGVIRVAKMVGIKDLVEEELSLEPENKYEKTLSREDCDKLVEYHIREDFLHFIEKYHLSNV